MVYSTSGSKLSALLVAGSTNHIKRKKVPVVISATFGRRLLMAMLLLAFLASFSIQFLLGRDGAASGETSSLMTSKLLRTYIPMFGVVAAFYFSEKGQNERNHHRVSAESLVFAGATVAIWVFLPIVALLTQNTFEGAIRLLEQFEIFGTSISLVGLTFYFSISAPPKKAS